MMETKKFDIRMADGACDCFAAFPEAGKRYPAVLFFMDGYGPRKYLYEMAEQIASLGYYVLLPNLLYRQRRAPILDVEYPVTPEKLPEARTQLMQIFGKHDPDSNAKDLSYFFDFLSKQPEVKPGKVGATGYCMGGGLALRTAGLYPDRVAAAASFHGGRLATNAPNSPHHLADKIQARLYFAHADADPSMPANEIERLEHALSEAGVRYESEVYRGAAHGFTMADLPAYNEAALKRHWEKLPELLKTELGG